MLRAFVLALLLALSSGFVLTARVPARASVPLMKANEGTPAENHSNTPGSTPNFKGGSFADYLAAKQKAEDEKKKAEKK